MFFFCNENVVSKGKKEISKEIDRKKQLEKEQAKLAEERQIMNLKTAAEFQCKFEAMSQSTPAEKKKYFNTMYELQDFLKADIESKHILTQLAFYSKYLHMTSVDIGQFCGVLESMPQLTVLWLSLHIAPKGEQWSECSKDAIIMLKDVVKKQFHKKLKGLFISFSFDTHDDGWSNSMNSINDIISQWDKVFKADTPLYRSEYKLTGKPEYLRALMKDKQ